MSELTDIDPEHVLAAQLTLRAVADIPEISMHTASPNSGLRAILEAQGVFTSPYWAHNWAGGLALARHVLDNPEIVRGLRVLDVGSGGGLVAIAARLSGARHVIAADCDPLAAIATSLNAQTNGVLIQCETLDASLGDWPEVDVVLGGDVFYDAKPARAFTRFAANMTARGILVLVGDPWRAHLPKARLELLKRYRVPDFGTGSVLVDAGVFQFLSANQPASSQ